ncbi:hypothetical protein B0T22DRAFT_299767 [Podospora appendiculata]|uniref:SET domain-containing protein n=1 Tax=Podospora appendiculata TaxID=314037 RepID=A0AAE0X0A9_9PEZI|nr:hypothetical protein B0T22DRAFT_299767 [Podospora appendiculata]
MAWGQLSLTRALMLGLLAQVAVADAADAKADPVPSGSADGLVYEAIEKTQIYADNNTATATTTPTTIQAPPVEGWWESKICEKGYCIYTNRKLVNGRGIALVTRYEEYLKVERTENHINKADNKYYMPDAVSETFIVNKGPALAAAKPLRRGKPVMSWSPVLLVHKDFFDDVVKKVDRKRILETAVSFLPPATLETFNKQRGDDGKRSVEAILRAAPFEVDLGYVAKPGDHAKHYANYPEVSILRHDCRPNLAFHIDDSLAHVTTVARRAAEGEELTIAYVDPFAPRAERQAWVQKYSPLGKPCACDACTARGNTAALKASDDRVVELLAIQAELKNHESRRVTEDLIDRYLELFDQERLQARLFNAYELAATNYNYLGLDVKAKKYADLAVQAGIVEEGVNANDVIAMRIMASDIRGHYTYQYTLKRLGKVPK